MTTNKPNEVLNFEKKPTNAEDLKLEIKTLRQQLESKETALKTLLAKAT